MKPTSYLTDAKQWRRDADTLLGCVPSDLAFVVAYVVVAVLALGFVPMSPPARALVGGPLVLFVPGYALVAAAYPRESDGGRTSRLAFGRRGRSDRGLSGVERVLLSFGTSVAVIPLVGFAAWVAFGTFTRPIVLAALAGFALLLVPVGALRRNNLPADERFTFRPTARARALAAWLFGSSTTTVVTNVLLAGGVVLAAVTLTYAFTVPTDGESYTSTALLTETEGELTASEYPTTFTAGEPESLVFQLTNNEGVSAEYTVVVAVERVEGSGSDLTVRERSELDRIQLSAQPGETVRHDHTVAPEMVGEDLRLSYYVYRDEPPADVDASSAYRTLHLWITVTR